MESFPRWKFADFLPRTEAGVSFSPGFQTAVGCFGPGRKGKALCATGGQSFPSFRVEGCGGSGQGNSWGWGDEGKWDRNLPQRLKPLHSGGCNSAAEAVPLQRSSSQADSGGDQFGEVGDRGEGVEDFSDEGETVAAQVSVVHHDHHLVEEEIDVGTESGDLLQG